MGNTVLYMSMSLDGFIAGPNEADDNGLRGCLIGRVEPDLLLAVTGLDRGDCRQRGSDNHEHERNSSSYCDPPSCRRP